MDALESWESTREAMALGGGGGVNFPQSVDYTGIYICAANLFCKRAMHLV